MLTPPDLFIPHFVVFELASVRVAIGFVNGVLLHHWNWSAIIWSNAFDLACMMSECFLSEPRNVPFATLARIPRHWNTRTEEPNEVVSHGAPFWLES